MNGILKKTSVVLFTGITIGSLWLMSLGLVGTIWAYVLILFNIFRVLLEILGARKISEKLNISTKIKEEIPRKVGHMLICLVTLPMIYFSFIGTWHTFTFCILALIAAFIMAKTGLLDIMISRSTKETSNNSSIFDMIVGFFINSTVAIFIPQYAIPTALGFTALGLGDPMACLIGKKFGKHKFKNGKSVEGVLGFIVGATISMFIMTHVSIWKLLIIATVGAVVELYSEDYDNVCIQLAVALVAVFLL